MSTSNLNHLPDEILAQVLDSIEPNELKLARLVCKNWENVIGSLFLHFRPTLSKANVNFVKCSALPFSHLKVEDFDAHEPHLMSTCSKRLSIFHRITKSLELTSVGEISHVQTFQKNCERLIALNPEIERLKFSGNYFSKIRQINSWTLWNINKLKQLDVDCGTSPASKILPQFYKLPKHSVSQLSVKTMTIRSTLWEDYTTVYKFVNSFKILQDLSLIHFPTQLRVPEPQMEILPLEKTKTELSKLKIIIHKYEGRIFNQGTSLLNLQTKLTILEIECEILQIEDVITNTIKKNASTLRKFTFHCGVSRNLSEMLLATNECKALESLILDGICIEGILNFPKNLKCLKLYGFFGQNHWCHILAKLQHLVELLYANYQYIGIDMNDGNVGAASSHPTLQVFYIHHFSCSPIITDYLQSHNIRNQSQLIDINTVYNRRQERYLKVNLK